MNIFAVSNDPYKCARALDDKRVVKMTLETCQILSTVVHMYDEEFHKEHDLYQPTHKKHPCVMWAAENVNNFKWLIKHFRHLLYQYEYRFSKEHACFQYLEAFYTFAYRDIQGYIPPTKFVNCTPYKDIADVHLAYQKCLDDKWNKTDKRKPTWFSVSK